MQNQQYQKPFLENERDRLGITNISNVDIRKNKLFSFLNKDFSFFLSEDVQTLQEYHYLLTVYILWLRQELGKSKAIKEVALNNLRQKTYELTTKYKFPSIEERRSHAISNNDYLKRIYNDINKHTAIIEQLEPVIWGLDNLSKKINSIISDKKNGNINEDKHG